jgi:hypothetical protein
MLKIIKSLYNNVKCCVKYKDILGDYFCNEVGLTQGETLYPLLFSLYVNEFEGSFISDNYPSIDLQLHVNTLHSYTEE